MPENSVEREAESVRVRQFFIPENSYTPPLRRGDTVPVYEEEEGVSLRISGQTDPSKVSRLIVSRWLVDRRPYVELFFIGANAGNQALKACLSALSILKHRFGVRAVVVPRWGVTQTEDPVSKDRSMKQGVVLRVIFEHTDDASKSSS